MPGSYIPLKIAQYSAWMLNYTTKLSAAPGTYGVTAGDAAGLAALYATFAADYAISAAPATQRRVSVQTTQTARNNLSTLARAFARIILANAGVLDSDKVALGLVIRDVHPSPIPTPGTAPVLGLIGCTPGIVTLTFRDTGSSLKSRSKPAGVTGLELHAFFGAVAPASPAATPFFSIQTRSPFALTVPVGSLGQHVWLYGRWLNAKGAAGPWSALLDTATV